MHDSGFLQFFQKAFIPGSMFDIRSVPPPGVSEGLDVRLD